MFRNGSFRILNIRFDVKLNMFVDYNRKCNKLTIINIKNLIQLIIFEFQRKERGQVKETTLPGVVLEESENRRKLSTDEGRTKTLTLWC